MSSLVLALIGLFLLQVPAIPTLDIEEEIKRSLDDVLATHLGAWKENLKILQGDNEEDSDVTDEEEDKSYARNPRSGFPTIKKKRKKIRACQSMAGEVC